MKLKIENVMFKISDIFRPNYNDLTSKNHTLTIKCNTPCILHIDN